MGTFRVRRLLSLILTLIWASISLIMLVWVVIISAPDFVTAGDDNNQQSILAGYLGYLESLWLAFKGAEAYLPNIITGIGIAVGTTVVTLAVSIPAAFALSRLRNHIAKVLMITGLVASLIPPLILVVGQEYILTRAHFWQGFDTLILVLAALHTPVTTWILHAVISKWPRIVDDYATVDGCNSYRSLIYLVLPQVLPTVKSLAVVIATICYADFLFFHSILDGTAGTMTNIGASIIDSPSTNPSPLAILFGALPGIIMITVFRDHFLKVAIWGLNPSSHPS